MHTALLAACVEQADQVAELCQVEAAADYLMERMDHGVVAAAGQLGQSQDDVFLLLHSMVTRLGLVVAPPEDLSLATHGDRVAWENAFCQMVVRPSIAELGTVKKRFQELVEKDKEAVVGRLHRVLYCRAEEGLETVPHTDQLWQVLH